MAQRNDFFVAVSGTAAALTGLIFVGVSISLTKILSIRGLPDRALLSLVLLLNVLILSILFLVPGLTAKTLGVLILTISLVTWIVTFRVDFRNIHNKEQQHKRQRFVGIVSLFKPEWRMVSAFVSGIYYAFARCMHFIKKPVGINETFALWTDLIIFAVILTYFIMTI